MPSWYYDQDVFHKTPSIQNGIDYETECAYRKEGARFIMDIGTQMDLGYNTMATGVVFFHRFYMFHSFTAFPRFVTACCCIFLAGKVEETPKKCKDIIKIAQTLLNKEVFSSFGIDPKKEVMTLEKILLQTIKFDLKVEHPYSYLIKYAKYLKGDKNRLHKMVQMAWTFINDSLCTTLCLQWEPEIIAIALMYLAGKLSRFQVINWTNKKACQTMWWDMFVEELPMTIIEDICHQVLDLYSTVNDKSQQTPSQTIKKIPDIKLENPVKLEIIPHQIQVKTEEKSRYCNKKIAKEKILANPKPIKHKSSINSTLDVNIKKESEISEVYDQPKSKIILHVAKWASISASMIMSPSTSSVNSPSFSTSNFLTSPKSIGPSNNHLNESTNHQNRNFDKNVPKRKQESKQVTLLRSQSNECYNRNKLCNNVPLDICRNNLSFNRRGFDNSNDKLSKSSRGFNNCIDNNALPSSLGIDNYNINAPFRSLGFDNFQDSVPSRKRVFDNVNENLSNNNHNFKIADFSKNYQSCDMFIQDHPDCKDVQQLMNNNFQYSAKIRYNRDPRTSSRDHPYHKSKNDFCVKSFPESNHSPENNINFKRYRSKQSERRFKKSRRFHGSMNNLNYKNI